MNIKTETKKVVVHKAGLYMTIDELHRCIMALSEQPNIEDEDRKLAEDLALIQTNALAEIEQMQEYQYSVTEEEVINSTQANCVGGNCD